MQYSVLMSVYAKETPGCLRTAIKSILNKSAPASEFVIVEDGELPDSLENVIRRFEEENPGLFRVIRRKVNRGLGYSLMEGVKACRYPVIARMDSDDYSTQERCRRQLEEIENGYDLVGSDIDEFEGVPANIISSKKMPETEEEIKKYMKFRNPFNHPSVMFRKEAVLAAGNYRSLYRLEDYDLWIRMIAHGARCINIDEPLVRMRVNREFYARRGGPANLKSHFILRKKMLQSGLITPLEYAAGCLMMTARAYCPGFIKEKIYRTKLRSKS